MTSAQQSPAQMAPATPAEAYWPAREDVPLSEHTVGSLLRERSMRTPDAPALVHVPAEGGAPRRWTYRQLLADAERLAAGLRVRVPAGAHVALWAPNVAEWPIVEYAAALAGVTLVTLNPVLTRDELEDALSVSKSSMLIHADASRSYDMAAVVAECAPALPELRHVLSLSDWDRLAADRPLPAPSAEVSAKTPAQIQFTSGTTGRPKAAVLTHQAIVNVARFTFELLKVPDKPVVVSPLPMFHTAGCVVSCLGPLWSGGTLVLLERFTPRALIETIRRERGNVLTSVPTVLAAILREVRPEESLPTLNSVLTGAAPVRTDLIRDFEAAFSTTVFNLYGQTEMAPVVTLTRPEDSVEVKTTTVGRPLPHLEVKIVDTETGATRRFGEAGEICARGYQQMAGYYGDEAATAKAIDEDGWLHAGDLGKLEVGGTLRILGRIKELIIRGGENITADDIEACLAQCPSVLAVSVVGVPDDTWGELVGAVLCLADGIAPDVARWRAHCRERLAPHKVPEVWFVVDEIPATASGKIRKPEIKRLIAAGSWKPIGTPAPAAPGLT